MKVWLKDPKTGRRSPTLTIAIYGTALMVAKLLMSGLAIKGFTFEVFTGTEFAAALTALWAPYSFRKWSDKGTPMAQPLSPALPQEKDPASSEPPLEGGA